ncbi:MAG: thermonuclease family protein [Nitrospira sp.]|nr:thermonuclease family protein [Nitrospira sp.]
MATTRSIFRYTTAILCISVAMVLALPSNVWANAQANAQTSTKSKTGRKAAPKPHTTQPCPCPPKLASAYAQAHRQLGFGKPANAPRPGTTRAMLQRMLPKSDAASSKQLRRDTAAARRLMFGRLPSAAQNRRPLILNGWDIRLIDGDTFAYGSERIRIRGIDTPEKSESGGFDATQRLDLLLREGQIVVMPEAVDKYGRMVADVYVNGSNVAEVLRKEGYAKPGSR